MRRAEHLSHPALDLTATFWLVTINADTEIPRGDHARLVPWLLLGAAICAAVMFVFVGRATAHWSDDVDIIAGRYAGTVCGFDVYTVMTNGPLYGTTEGGDPEGRNPAYEAACTNAASPAWEAGKAELRSATPFAVVALALTLASAFVWFRARRERTMPR